MQIQSFKIFRDLVQSGSFSAAAEANGLTQSAVSQQIKALEDRFAVKLLDRSRKVLTLTLEGEAFLETSRDVLGAIEALEHRIGLLRDVVAGKLRIATVFSIGLHELPPYLKQFRQSYPEVEVQVEYRRSGQVYAAVLEGLAEIGLVAYPAPRRGLEVLPFWRDELVVICPPTHRLANRRRVRLGEIGGERFIAFEPDLPTRKAIDRHLRDARVRVRHAMEFDSVETVKRTVEIENAISIVPETSVRTEVAAGTLVALSIEHETPLTRPLGAIVKKNARSLPAIREFLAMLEKFDLGGEQSRAI